MISSTTRPSLLILDLDGTIRTCTIEGQPCPNRVGEQKLIPGVKELIKQAREAGVVVVGATNQGGIGLGHMTLEDHKKITQELRDLLSFPDFRVYTCPHAPSFGCNCRKPRPGLLHRAMRDVGVEARRTLFVGDRESDRLAAANAGVDFKTAENWLKQTGHQ